MVIGLFVGIAIGGFVVFLFSLAAHYTLLTDLRTQREENARLRNAELDRLLAKVAVDSLEGHIHVFGEQVVVLANPKGAMN